MKKLLSEATVDIALVSDIQLYRPGRYFGFLDSWASGGNYAYDSATWHSWFVQTFRFEQNLSNSQMIVTHLQTESSQKSSSRG